jgi:hypothetical protein
LRRKRTTTSSSPTMAPDLEVFRIGLDAAMAAWHGDATPTMERLLAAGYRAARVAKPD